jgi:AICAR transformylase/IMP cyclohydrolase PurH
MENVMYKRILTFMVPEKAEIPVFPQATPDTGKYEDVRKTAEDREIAAIPEMNIEIKAYTTIASLDEVISFYNDTLADWGTAERTDEPQTKMTQMKWVKNDNQVFNLFYVPSGAIGEDTVLMIEQAWAK